MKDKYIKCFKREERALIRRNFDRDCIKLIMKSSINNRHRCFSFCDCRHLKFAYVTREYDLNLLDNSDSEHEISLTYKKR